MATYTLKRMFRWMVMKETNVFKILNDIREYELSSGKVLTNSEKVAIITEALKKDTKLRNRSKRHDQ